MQRLRPLRRFVRRPFDRGVHPPAHVAGQEKEEDAERDEQNCAQNDEDLFPHSSDPPAENVRQASSLPRLAGKGRFREAIDKLEACWTALNDSYRCSAPSRT